MIIYIIKYINNKYFIMSSILKFNNKYIDIEINIIYDKFIEIILYDNLIRYVSISLLDEHFNIILLTDYFTSCTKFINILLYAINHNNYELYFNNNEYILIFNINIYNNVIQYKYNCLLDNEQYMDNIIMNINDIHV